MEVGHLGHSWRRQHPLWSEVTLGLNSPSASGRLDKFLNLSGPQFLSCSTGTAFTLSQEALRTGNNASRHEPGWRELEAAGVCGSPPEKFRTADVRCGGGSEGRADGGGGRAPPGSGAVSWGLYMLEAGREERSRGASGRVWGGRPGECAEKGWEQGDREGDK